MMKGKRIVKSRNAPKEPLLDKVEKSKTPEWILKRYPDAPKELPKQVVEEFNEHLREAGELTDRYEKGLFDMKEVDDRLAHSRVKIYAKRAEKENRDLGKVLEEALVFTDFMNNFSYTIFGRRQMYSDESMKEKFGNARNAGGYQASDLLKNQTRQEFYDTMLKVMEECGLSYEKGKELFKMPGNSANRYLFPAFLKLLEMGYKRYPDLVA